VASRRPFLLRIDAAVLDAVQRWANDDLRSLNGQIEFLLRRALRESGRLELGQPQRGDERVDEAGGPEGGGEGEPR
jgi:hypothetical protein